MSGPAPSNSIEEKPAWREKYNRPMDGSRRWYHRGEGSGCNSLPLQLGAAEKYDQLGNALPFPGLTFVTFLDPKSPAYRELVFNSKYLGWDLENASLKGKFSFLPSDTYHVTIADCVTNHSKSLQEGIVEATRKAFGNLQAVRAPRFELRPDFVISSGTSFVALADPKTEQDLGIIHHIREVLAKEINPVLEPFGLKMPNPESFIGHITLAYLCQGISAGDEYERFLDVARKYDKLRELLGEFVMKSLELQRFGSMVNWGERSLLGLDLS